MTDTRRFEAWWQGQDTGLGNAFRFAAWNAWLASSAAEREAWRTVAWVVREIETTSPMHRFELSLPDAEATQLRWADDGYKSEIVELRERSNV